ncbi:tripartite tricarboxylate transporter TctB family protein [Oceaniglobus roseus]|uniref:tripartite tricarboxylate transporter TctB family protein n=1 Tax=Oceaniglobus roseus TaxID=1737570 RepID=UPI000C7F746D|nr:tripartite tricarboxylate transporter TctB family protein [Kandeliimicrobium roseum]
MNRLSRHLTGGAGHLALLAAFAAFTVWYTADAWAAQSKVQNMLLIGPAAALSLVLILVLAVAEARRIAKGTDAAPPPETPPDTFAAKHGTPIAAGLMGVYVIAMPLVGFDVATVVYVAVSMVLQGARDWRIILAFSLVAGLLPVWAIEEMLSIPVPTLVL